MINKAPDINRTKLSIFLRNINRYFDYYSTLPPKEKNNLSLQKAILESYTKDESKNQLGYWKRRAKIIPLDEESLKLFPPEVLKDKETVKKIIKHNFMLYKYLDKSLKTDQEMINYFFKECIDFNYSLQAKSQKEIELSINDYFPGFNKSKELCLKVCKASCSRTYLKEAVFNQLSLDIKLDKNFITELLKEDFNLYPLIPVSLQENHEVMIETMKSSSGRVFGYFPKELRGDVFFCHYMSKIHPLYYNYFTGELAKQYKASNSEDIPSFLETMMLKEKLEEEVVDKKIEGKLSIRNKI